MLLDFQDTLDDVFKYGMILYGQDGIWRSLYMVISMM